VVIVDRLVVLLATRETMRDCVFATPPRRWGYETPLATRGPPSPPAEIDGD